MGKSLLIITCPLITSFAKAMVPLTIASPEIEKFENWDWVAEWLGIDAMYRLVTSNIERESKDIKISLGKWSRVKSN
jgi:hypothetical protein